MHYCNDCQHSFPDPTEYLGDEMDEMDETYLGCPFCGSVRYHDSISEAEAYADGWENGR